MKKNLVSLIALLFAITSCQTNNIIIEGTIKDYNAESAPPLFIASSKMDLEWCFNDTINVDSTGYFRVDFPAIEDAIFISIRAKSSYLTFIAEEGETHSFTVDLPARKIIFNTEGENQEGIDLMNTYLDPSYNLELFHLLDSCSNEETKMDRVILMFEKKEAIELSKFKELYDTQKISKSFYELFLIRQKLMYDKIKAGIVELHSMGWF